MMDDIISQLIEIYYNHENWHDKKLSIKDSCNYFSKLIFSGNIILCLDGNRVAGYIEFFRINPNQLNKIFNKDFYVFDENIKDGNICYVNSIYINNIYRKSFVMNFLKSKLFECNKDCNFFVGHEVKYNKRLRIKRGKYGWR